MAASLLRILTIYVRSTLRPGRCIRGCLPALAVTIAGEDLIGLRGSGFEPWMIVALYVLLIAYVIGRLFPWREIDAMASDPDATVGSVMAELRAHERPRRMEGHTA